VDLKNVGIGRVYLAIRISWLSIDYLRLVIFSNTLDVDIGETQFWVKPPHPH